MAPKPIWQSKTFWINVVGLAILIVQTVQPQLPIPSAQYGVLALAILNVINRFLTTGSVSVTGK